jgi:LmbE family N-acetylglucosaminyl deacetylase/SAM-dependent methyltransferase
VDTHFDSRDAGTAEHAWLSSWLPTVPAIPLPRSVGRLLVLAAHPDDETLGAGGLIATAAARGIATTIVVASDGEASHPRSPTHSPAQLAQLRRAEVVRAIAELHPHADVHILGLPDSALSGQVDEIVDAIDRNIDASTLLVTPWIGDRHPDHEACGAAGARVAHRAGIDHWQAPIWAWHWATPLAPELPRPRLRRLPLEAASVASKARAMAAHVSQHTALSAQAGDEAILGPSMLSHFERPFEVFVVAESAAAGNEFFDDLYAQRSDPWGLSERFYERRKRDLLLAGLPRRQFRRAFEPGCATGLLTVELAQRCNQVVAWDGAQRAVDQTLARIEGHALANVVTVERARIPKDWPAGEFDLIVLSEVGYYCADQSLLSTRVDESLGSDGVLVACHWRHPAPDHPCTAEEVHAALGQTMHRIVAHREDDFLLDIWTRDGASVATLEGILR